MIAAVKMVLDECDDTEADVLMLADSLEKFGFDKLKNVLSYMDLVNRKGRGGYRRV